MAVAYCNHAAASCYHAVCGLRVLVCDRVIVMLPRLPQWHIAMVGCIKLGAIFSV